MCQRCPGRGQDDCNSTYWWSAEPECQRCRAAPGAAKKTHHWMVRSAHQACVASLLRDAADRRCPASRTFIRSLLLCQQHLDMMTLCFKNLTVFHHITEKTLANYIISAISPRKIRSLSQCLRPFDIDGTVLPNISIIRSFAVSTIL